jgi:DHA2 family multidrug resistance protein
MPLSGILSNKMDPRPLIGGAFVIQIFALWHMSHLSTDLAFKDAAIARMIQAFGLPFLFIPITQVAYVGLKPEQSNQASGLMNVTRNLGGSIGISLVQTLLAQRQQFHQSRMVEDLNPLNPNYVSATAQMAHQLAGQGATAAQAVQGQLYQMVQKQASMLSYLDAFRVLMFVIIVLLPLVFLLKGKPPGGAGGGAA